MFVIFGILFLIPIYLQTLHQETAAQSGAIQGTLALATLAILPIALLAMHESFLLSALLIVIALLALCFVPKRKSNWNAGVSWKPLSSIDDSSGVQESRKEPLASMVGVLYFHFEV